MASASGGHNQYKGAIIRGDSTQKKIALVFTGHEFAEGGSFIEEALDNANIKASFFFTGDFYRNKSFHPVIRKLQKEGHYLGPHSDKHLLYCDWSKPDSLLVTKNQFRFDLADNYTAMARLGIDIKRAKYFLPPYEWYNDSIANWSKELQVQLINYTPGTLSHADYTTDKDKNYRSSEKILASILQAEQNRPAGLNGFILLMHIGAGPGRTDKFYRKLPELVRYLKTKGYQFQRVDEIVETD
ncbi:MAG: polysaccharide deacetylase family protein [Chitinophagaceae bacterium]|nr:polysaccharide deacetylase family protein [Chitinophagaceae bacterium]